ncbi:hypothetical protein CHS0354_012626 [Potamilus streckersoni]|uniref:Platelet-derived growth factor receptor-like protein n=1 Tax=Potamilus streckersoni TaxID=2493646 RepID=A0AAE0W4A9_9BIVA|nr:hypothetical protein CHS0354_012626 [Potamilus streckersoni]
MGIKVLRVLCVMFILWPVSRAQVNRGRHDNQVPIIDFSQGDEDRLIDGALVVNTNRNISLSCDGLMYPVEWVVELGDRTIGPSFGDDAHDKLQTVSESFAARLMGTSLGHSYTGRYICRYSDAKDRNSSIYIYISDPAHPFVLEAPQFPIIQPVYQNKPFVLPCRTTRPDISVEFKKNFVSVPREKYKFYPEQGIVVDYSEQFFSGFFTCSVQSQTINFILQYLADPGPVIITSLLPSSYLMLVGESFNITCKTYVTSGTGLSMRWNYPYMQRSKKPMIIPAFRVHGSQNRDEIISEFHLNDTKLNDSGTYRCTLELNSGQLTFKEVNITIIDKTFVFLTPEKDLYEVEEGIEVVMVVTFKSYPLPRFEWFKDGKLINRNPRVEGNAVGIIFMKAERNMAGIYTLHAYTRDQNATTDIMLLVKYKCPDGYVHQNKSKVYNCEACPEGSYSSNDRMKCHPCPENSKTNGTARSSIDDCKCLLGFYAKRIQNNATRTEKYAIEISEYANYTSDNHKKSESDEEITFICEEVRVNVKPLRSNEASHIIHNFLLLLSLACIWLLNFSSY